MTNVTCCAYNCGNSFGREGITFHRFPLDKPNLLAKWIHSMGKPKWTPTKDHFVCSEHFTDEMFNEKKGYRFVKYDAVPTKMFSLPRPKTFFPAKYQNRIMTLKEVEEDFNKGYVIEAKLLIETEEEFNDWFKIHQDVTKVKYTLFQTFPKASKNLAFKSEYICSHVPASNQPSCPAKLLCRIRSNNQKFNKPHEPANYPCTVVLYHLHNHRVQSNVFEVSHQMLDMVSEKLREKFMEMFKGCYSPEEAFEMHLRDLLDEYPDTYEEVVNNRSLCPTLEWSQQLYEDFINEFDEWSEEKEVALLENEIAQINVDNGRAKMKKIGNDVIVALCTPLMQRAHSLKTAGEIVFCDSSGLIPGCKCYVYTLVVYGCSEGLPICVLMTTSDTEEVLTHGFQLLVEVLPEKSFGEYGKLGPEIFFTPNVEAESNSIKATFPDATLLMCAFSMLKSVWCWLWDDENAIQEEDRCTLFTLLHEIMKTQNGDEFKKTCDDTLLNESVAKYPNFQELFKEVSDLSDKWGVRFKNEIIDGNKEISGVEMANLVLKDKMYMEKAYNKAQMFKFLYYDLEDYFKQKINHCINNSMDVFLHSCFPPSMKSVEGLEVVLLSTGQYKICDPKTAKAFYVDVEVSVCSCTLGQKGSRCKHQYAICMSKKADTSFPQLENTIKQELHWIATNSSNSLFGTMQPETVDSDTGYEIMDDEEYDPRQDLPIPRKIGRPRGPKKPPTPKEEAKAILERVVKDIIQRYDTSPNEYHRAIVAMAVNYQSLHYDTPIMAALKNFGKNIN